MDKPAITTAVDFLQQQEALEREALEASCLVVEFL
jgi:hypothetical protein